ncbi:MAG: Na(+)/H(+) antiporter subunit D [Desulfobacterales bacterium]|nr:Na(+)/H(+) antiporter subunit D [Desulfobacterales bacterium]
MTATNSFFHPAFFYIALAMVLPFIRGRFYYWRWLLLVPSVVAIISVISMDHGTYMVIPWLGHDLILGRVDRLSIVFAHVFAIMSLIGFIYGFHLKEKAHHIAATLYVGGSFGCVFAGDYLTLFVFWELMSMASVFLVWLRRNPVSTRAGFRYFFFHAVGGLLLLAGLLYRYYAVGTFAFTAVDPSNAQFYDYLIMAGFCVNTATIPLHAWLSDAYPEATVAGAVFMCAFTTKTAVYVLARGFSGFYILAVMGTLTAIYGVLYASIENNARRILSYHIISQVGYMVAGIGIGTLMTVNGAVAHAYAHILYKGLLFMGAGCLLYAAGTANLDKLGGLVGRIPLVMIGYMVGAVSISGMPFFNGFISKTMTIAGAAHAHYTWLAIGLEVAAVGTFLSVGIKLPYFAFWSKPIYKGELRPIPINMYIAMGIASGLCILQGVYPNVLYNLLPYPAEAMKYHPYTAWHLVQSFMLLSFTGLGFYFMRTVIAPHPGRNLDFDVLYRLIVNTFAFIICKPLAWMDNIWTNVYRIFGMRGLLGLGTGTKWFDLKGIDLVVDGTAYTVGDIGGVSAKAQTGRLQDYLAWTVIVALCVFAIVWWL